MTEVIPTFTVFGPMAGVVIAKLDSAIYPTKKMDARVTSAFTRVFDALCPRMTSQTLRSLE
jgi:hypothetical protein